jgi:glycerol-3-phosphate acyltransferase PlsY
VVLLVTRYMAIASICGVSATMLFGAILKNQSLQMEPFYALLSLSVAFRHRNNLRRLLAGTEPKYGAKNRTESENPPNQHGGEERLEDK